MENFINALGRFYKTVILLTITILVVLYFIGSITGKKETPQSKVNMNNTTFTCGDYSCDVKTEVTNVSKQDITYISIQWNVMDKENKIVGTGIALHTTAIKPNQTWVAKSYTTAKPNEASTIRVVKLNVI